jgi:phage head maturation protease
VIERHVPLAGTIDGIVCRLGRPVTASSSGTGAPGLRVSYAPGAFDGWLTTVLPAAVVVQLDHQSVILGRWRDFRIVGDALVGTAELWNTPHGTSVMNRVARGEIKALSSSVLFIAADTTNERDAEGEYVLVHRATVQEAGPSVDPADPGARITAFELFDPAAADSRSEATPDDVDAMIEAQRSAYLEERRLARLGEPERVAEQVARIDRCASALRRARMQADVMWRSRTDRLGGAYTLAECRAADDAAAAIDADLRAMAGLDVYRILTADMPAAVPPQRRMLADAARSVGR